MNALAAESTPGFPELVAELRARLAEVRASIRAACERAGRPPSSVRIVGVTKKRPPEVVQAAVAVGLTDLAENRVQEMLVKMEAVDVSSEPADEAAAAAGEHGGLGGRVVNWHLVGRLQRNKARDVVGRAVLVHSLDRTSLANELSRRAEQAGVVQRVLVQVNVAGDPVKAGCSPDRLLGLVGHVRSRPNLVVEGLMTMPPLPSTGIDPGQAARPYFARLRELRDKVREECPEVTHLSMGMSGDFEVAIEEGATIVRLGTALFGPRPDEPYGPSPTEPAGGRIPEEER
ncbi:MAG: YggS family pyridoxal phosphate-dependent enzyme [Actinomycetota bacterium]|nr:YggS family pyridoxal phosphate-dependent enzyme [Actinomycetota bacterium]